MVNRFFDIDGFVKLSCPIQHYVIQFVSDLRQVGGFLRFPPPIKLTGLKNQPNLVFVVVISVEHL